MTALPYTSGSAVKVRLGIGTADTADDTRIASVAFAVNDWLETYVGRAIGPVGSAVYTFDGWASYDDRKALYVSPGLQSINSITVATFTGGSPVAVSTADYHISPRIQDRRNDDWPGFEIRMHDIFVGQVPVFWPGYGNVVVDGVWGWLNIPPTLTDVAEQLAVRIWRARQSGQTDIVGNDEFGAQAVTRYVSGEDRAKLRIYKDDLMVPG